MLMDYFRNKKGSFFTIIIFGFIIFTFVLWGGYQSGEFKPGTFLSVNGEDIPYDQYRRRLSYRMDSYSKLFGGTKMDPRIQQMLETQIAGELIVAKLMSQKASEMGITVGKEEILNTLKENKSFHDPKLNRFSPSIYKRVLEANNFRPKDFEASLKEDLAIDRLRWLLESTIVVTDQQIRDAYRMENVQMTLDTAQLDPSKVSQSVLQITDKEIADHYEANKAQYLSPERRIIELGTLDLQKWSSLLEVSDEQRKTYYDDNIASSDDPKWAEKLVRARHILISDSSKAGLDRLKKIKSSIKTEQDFILAAISQSEDFSNSSDGGDLGYFDAKAMVKPFSEAAFKKARTGEVYGPISTDFGHHLIWRLDITDGKKSLKSLQKLIDHEIKKEAQAEKAKEVESAIQSQIAGKPGERTKTLSDMGFEVRETRPLTNKDRSSLIPYALVNKAMSTEVNIWQPLEVMKNQAIAWRVKSIVEPKPLSLAEAKPIILGELEKTGVEKMAKDQAMLLKTNPKAWSQLAKKGFELSTHKNFKPFEASTVPNFSDSDLLMQAVQKLTQEKSTSNALLHEGKWVIFRGQNFTEAKTALPEAEKKALQEKLISQMKVDVFQKFEKELVKTSDLSDEIRKKYNL